MAYSRVEYTGDGTQTNFTFSFPYLSQSHVLARLDGVETEFTWINASTIQFSSAPASGAVIEIFRQTERDERLVDFTNGAIVNEDSLDTSALQNFYLVQESLDAFEASLGGTSSTAWDALNRRIINVADPVDDQDAATRLWVEEYADAVASGQGGMSGTVWTFTGNGLTKTFPITGADVSIPQGYLVSLDGSLLRPDTDYTVSVDDGEITFTTAPGDTLFGFVWQVGFQRTINEPAAQSVDISKLNQSDRWDYPYTVDGPAYASSTSFEFVSDPSGRLHAERQVRVVQASGTKYATVQEVSGTTATLANITDSDGTASTLSDEPMSVFSGIVGLHNVSLPLTFIGGVPLASYAKQDGVTDDTAAFERASALALAAGLPLLVSGPVRLVEASLSAARVDCCAIKGITQDAKLELEGNVLFYVYDGFSIEDINIETDYQVLNTGSTSETFFYAERVDNCTIRNIRYINTGAVLDGSSRGNGLFRVAGDNLSVEKLYVSGARMALIAEADASIPSKNASFDNIVFENTQTGIFINGDTADTYDEANFFDGVAFSRLSLKNTSTQSGNSSQVNGSDLALVRHTKGFQASMVKCERPVERCFYINKCRDVVIDNVELINSEGIKFVGFVDSSASISYIADGFKCSNVLHKNGNTAGARTFIFYECKNVRVDGVEVNGEGFGSNINHVVLLERSTDHVHISGITGAYVQRSVVHISLTDSATYTSRADNIVVENVEITDPVMAGNYPVIRFSTDIAGTSNLVDGLSIYNVRARGTATAVGIDQFSGYFNASARLTALLDIDRAKRIRTGGNYLFGHSTLTGWIKTGANCDDVVCRETGVRVADADTALNAADARFSGGSSLSFVTADTSKSGTENLTLSPDAITTAPALLSAGASGQYNASMELVDSGTKAVPFNASFSAIGTATSASGEYITFLAKSGGVTKINGSTNTAASDTAGSLCVFVSGSSLIVKNRLGTTQRVGVSYTLQA